MQNNKTFLSSIFVKIAFLVSVVTIQLFAFANIASAVDIKKWQTKEGLQVFYVQTTGLPIVDIALSFKSGEARDTKEKAGLAGFTQDLVTNSNNKYSEELVAKTIADYGAQMSGSVAKDYSTFRLRMLDDDEIIKNVTKLWVSLLTQPKFNKKILKREITRAVASYRESLTSPATIASRAFVSAAYGEHPYGYQEDDKTYANIQVDDLNKYYRENYQSENAVIVFVGSISKEEASAIANQISQKLKKQNGKYQNKNLTEFARPKSTTKTVIEKEFDSQQVHIYAGMPFIERGHPDFFPLLVGNYVLGGGGFASQLMNVIREENGLAYSVSSSFSLHKYRGLFIINLQTKAENTYKAVDLVYKTIKKFIADGVSDKKLTTAKSYLSGSFPLKLDSNSKTIGLVSMIAIYNLPLDYLDTWIGKVNSVTKDDIRAAFERNFNFDEMILIKVGVAKK